MKPKTVLFAEARKKFHSKLLNSVLSCSSNGVTSNADDGNKASVKIARLVGDALGTMKVQPKLAGQTSGKRFEIECKEFLADTFLELGHLRPGNWSLSVLEQSDQHGISRFEQYAHLSMLAKAVEQSPELATVLGNDYLITPDIVISRKPESDNSINKNQLLVDGKTAVRSPLRSSSGSQSLIHASVSCKWTLRSDRAQNARSEALNLIRNRKGRVPHIVSITAEPLPGRIASLALGTSDLDCVYHFALPELLSVVTSEAFPDAYETLKMLVDGKRLRDIADLPLDLCV